MATDAEAYDKWRNVMPVLYDWFTEQVNYWPSYTCRWGQVIAENDSLLNQAIYYSEMTDDSEQHKITIASVDVYKENKSPVFTNWKRMRKLSDLRIHKQIVHPGPVNKIREFQQYPDLFVTHSDSPNLFVWNVAQHPGPTSAEKSEEYPAELKLIGHTQNAEFAMGISTMDPIVISGGRDCNICLWDLRDSISNLMKEQAPLNGSDQKETRKAPELKAQGFFEGHTGTVEDCMFVPGSQTEFISVGDDSKILMWDSRAGNTPRLTINEAHGDVDIHTVDCSTFNSNFATGAADGTVKIWDIRQFGQQDLAWVLDFHKQSVVKIEFNPLKSGVFASGGEDNVVCIWDLEGSIRRSGTSTSRKTKLTIPEEILFQHCGHRTPINDFQWNPIDMWTIMSTSEDMPLNASQSSGGNIQLWRISNLITSLEQDAISHIEHFATKLESETMATTGNKMRKKRKMSKTEVSAAATAVATVTADDKPITIDFEDSEEEHQEEADVSKEDKKE